jgi:hypothetical protein
MMIFKLCVAAFTALMVGAWAERARAAPALSSSTPTVQLVDVR